MTGNVIERYKKMKDEEVEKEHRDLLESKQEELLENERKREREYPHGMVQREKNLINCWKGMRQMIS